MYRELAMFRYAMLASVILAFAVLPVLAAKEAKKAGEKSVPKADEAVPMKVTVVSVSGIAHKLQAAAPKVQWKLIRSGDVLGELTVVRTGLGAKVVLKFSDRGEVTVKSATKVGIGQFRRKGKLVKTRIGLKYGSMRASVDSAAGPNDFRVTTPVAALSVRGTKGRIAFSGDLGLHIRGTQGTWSAKKGKRSMTVGAGESTDGKFTLSSELAGGIRDPKMGDPGGLTSKEQKNLNKHGGGRGIIVFTGSTGGSKGGFAGIRGSVPVGRRRRTEDSDDVPASTGTPNRRNRLIIIYPDN